MFTVTVPAEDRKLLTIEQLREAAGLEAGDVSRDGALESLGLAVADRIAQECAVTSDGVHIPTLKRETVSQTFRLSSSVSALILARRFVASVSSLTIDGVAAAASDYELAAAAGMTRRLYDGRYGLWCPAVVVVSYQAGFSAVPDDLALAAMQAVQEQWSAKNRDPLLKRDKVDGMGEQEFWIGGFGAAGSGSAFSPAVQAMLDPYRTVWVS
ncbi:hypothetical protein [Ancylobacter sp. IITR112]|uniref:hypothetical protein n=1 Tax=Ancylobacter sp. IITR112 TaxID=3138073 RepID=UPI00352B10DE